jgi:phosphate transport system permease protein
VPSVIYALWGLWVVLPYLLRPISDFLAKYLGFIPIFAGPSTGLSFFAAGIILSIMITPIITSLCREIFRSVPSADRHAAYALGATRWEMIREAVLPRSRGGVVGATMLGLGRALGETIVVAMLIGNSPTINASIFKAGGSIAGAIANGWGEATGIQISALVGAGVVLFVITIIVNMVARGLVYRLNRA